jgi:hypothetical protein
MQAAKENDVDIRKEGITEYRFSKEGENQDSKRR